MAGRLLYIVAFSIASCAVCGTLSKSLAQAASISSTFAPQAPQRKLADCVFGDEAPVSFGNGTISASVGGAVTLEGSNRIGGKWTAVYPAAPGAGCQLWSVRWPEDTTDSLALVAFGVDNSGGWGTTLSLLRFDQDGSPFPWLATSNFTLNDKGLQQLVTLGEEKTSAVIVPFRDLSLTGESVTKYQRYTLSGTMLRSIPSSRAGSGPSVSEDPRNIQRPDAATLASDRPFRNGSVSQSKFTTFQGIIGNNDSDRRIGFSNVTIPMPDVAVVDGNHQRRIIFLPVKANLSIVKVGLAKGMPLGTDCANGDCHPVVVWFKQ